MSWVRFDKRMIGAAQVALVLFCFLVFAGCSSKLMSVMFDVPPPAPDSDVAVEPEQDVVDEAQSGDPLLAALWQDSEAERPEIESAKTWEQALEILPKGEKETVDWSAAVRNGTVRPRAFAAEDLLAKAFKMDFVLPSEKPKFEAWFPHSAHTEWLGCHNCHGSVFKYADNEMTMKEMRSGKYCGACHNEIAFSLKECGRCHVAMKK